MPPCGLHRGPSRPSWVLLRARLELALVLKELPRAGQLPSCLRVPRGPRVTFGPSWPRRLAGADDAGGVPGRGGHLRRRVARRGGSAGELTLKTLRSGAWSHAAEHHRRRHVHRDRPDPASGEPRTANSVEDPVQGSRRPHPAGSASRALGDRIGVAQQRGVQACTYADGAFRIVTSARAPGALPLSTAHRWGADMRLRLRRERHPSCRNASVARLMVLSGTAATSPARYPGTIRVPNSIVGIRNGRDHTCRRCSPETRPGTTPGLNGLCR